MDAGKRFKNGNSLGMNAGSLMETAIVTLRRDSLLAEIYAVMNRHRQADFPVVDTDARLVGMVYEESILKVLNASFPAMDSPLADVQDVARRTASALSLRAEEIMTPAISWVSTETDIGKVAAVMVEKGVRCLPVFGDGRVLGMISERAIFMELLKQGVELKGSPSVAALEPPQSQDLAISEKRLYPRKPVLFKLAYKLTDVRGTPMDSPGRIARCRNLSLGGMLVHVSETVNQEDVLDLAFEIPSFETPIRKLARVVRIVSVPEGGLGLGLMFLALSDQEMAALSHYLKYLPD